MSTASQPQTIDMGASMETEEALEIIDALNEVSDVLAMAGPEVTFVGERKASLAPAGAHSGAEVFACPRGWFVLCRVLQGAHRPATGASLEAALQQIEDQALREAVRGSAAAQGLL